VARFVLGPICGGVLSSEAIADAPPWSVMRKCRGYSGRHDGPTISSAQKLGWKPSSGRPGEIP
jgi:hypothetical protein